MKQYTFKLVDANFWLMRRTLNPNVNTPKVIGADVVDYQQVAGHCCKMMVSYDNGETKQYLAQVTQNPITKLWSVSCGYSTVEVVEAD